MGRYLVKAGMIIGLVVMLGCSGQTLEFDFQIRMVQGTESISIKRVHFINEMSMSSSRLFNYEEHITSFDYVWLIHETSPHFLKVDLMDESGKEWSEVFSIDERTFDVGFKSKMWVGSDFKCDVGENYRILRRPKEYVDRKGYKGVLELIYEIGLFKMR